MRPGDFALVRTNGVIGWLIRVVTRSQYNHARLIVADNGTVLEANPTGAEVGHVRAGDVVVSVPLTDEQRAQIPFVAIHLLGRPYGFLDVAALGLSRLGLRIPSVRRRIANPRTLFCSQLVDLAWANVGFQAFADGRTPQDVTPGDLDDLAKRGGWPRSSGGGAS